MAALFELGNPYKRFAEFVRFTSRHVLDGANKQFLETIVQTSESRKRRMNAGTRLWRSQVGFVQGKLPITDDAGKQIRCIDYPFPLGVERMKPLTDRAYEGRVNPKGIPCLYLSNDMNTSMTEVRPWIGSYVSVSEFELNRDLILVDVSVDNFNLLTTSPKFTLDEREQVVWWMINSAFSKPVTRSDDTADYAPTQVIAEAFRQDGCDGLIYGSTLGKGSNIAVFDLKAAEIVSSHLYRVDKVKLEFTDCTRKYKITSF